MGKKYLVFCHVISQAEQRLRHFAHHGSDAKSEASTLGECHIPGKDDREMVHHKTAIIALELALHDDGNGNKDDI